jgi:hypothetical protein
MSNPTPKDVPEIILQPNNYRAIIWQLASSIMNGTSDQVELARQGKESGPTTTIRY